MWNTVRGNSHVPARGNAAHASPRPPDALGKSAREDRGDQSNPRTDVPPGQLSRRERLQGQ